MLAPCSGAYYSLKYHSWYSPIPLITSRPVFNIQTMPNQLYWLDKQLPHLEFIYFKSDRDCSNHQLPPHDSQRLISLIPNYSSSRIPSPPSTTVGCWYCNGTRKPQNVPEYPAVPDAGITRPTTDLKCQGKMSNKRRPGKVKRSSKPHQARIVAMYT